MHAQLRIGSFRWVSQASNLQYYDAQLYSLYSTRLSTLVVVALLLLAN
jgi:hypothetical protein